MAPNAVPLSTEVIANRGAPDEWRGSLGELIDANPDDPLDLDALLPALARGVAHVGGGGAEAGFTVELADGGIVVATPERTWSTTLAAFFARDDIGALALERAFVAAALAAGDTVMIYRPGAPPLTLSPLLADAP
jgi:hypothetical protein